MARALYDNIAESPDELAFRKGDELTVLEQNTGGIEGWWLCSLRGRQVRRLLLFFCSPTLLPPCAGYFHHVSIILFPLFYLSSIFYTF